MIDGLRRGLFTEDDEQYTELSKQLLEILTQQNQNTQDMLNTQKSIASVPMKVYEDQNESLDKKYMLENIITDNDLMDSDSVLKLFEELTGESITIFGNNLEEI
mgnify:CR=1 FL=1